MSILSGSSVYSGLPPPPAQLPPTQEEVEKEFEGEITLKSMQIRKEKIENILINPKFVIAELQGKPLQFDLRKELLLPLKQKLVSKQIFVSDPELEGGFSIHVIDPTYTFADIDIEFRICCGPLNDIEIQNTISTFIKNFVFEQIVKVTHRSVFKHFKEDQITEILMKNFLKIIPITDKTGVLLIYQITIGNIIQINFPIINRFPLLGRKSICPIDTLRVGVFTNKFQIINQAAYHAIALHRTALPNPEEVVGLSLRAIHYNTRGITFTNQAQISKAIQKAFQSYYLPQTTFVDKRPVNKPVYGTVFADFQAKHYFTTDKGILVYFLNTLCEILKLSDAESLSYCHSIARSTKEHNPLALLIHNQPLSFIRNVVDLLQGLIFYDTLHGKENSRAYEFNFANNELVMQFSVTEGKRTYYVNVDKYPLQIFNSLFHACTSLQMTLEKEKPVKNALSNILKAFKFVQTDLNEKELKELFTNLISDSLKPHIIKLINRTPDNDFMGFYSRVASIAGETITKNAIWVQEIQKLYERVDNLSSRDFQKLLQLFHTFSTFSQEISPDLKLLLHGLITKILQISKTKNATADHQGAQKLAFAFLRCKISTDVQKEEIHGLLIDLINRLNLNSELVQKFGLICEFICTTMTWKTQKNQVEALFQRLKKQLFEYTEDLIALPNSLEKEAVLYQYCFTLVKLFDVSHPQTIFPKVFNALLKIASENQKLTGEERYEKNRNIRIELIAILTPKAKKEFKEYLKKALINEIFLLLPIDLTKNMNEQFLKLIKMFISIDKAENEDDQRENQFEAIKKFALMIVEWNDDLSIEMLPILHHIHQQNAKLPTLQLAYKLLHLNTDKNHTSLLSIYHKWIAPHLEDGVENPAILKAQIIVQMGIITHINSTDVKTIADQQKIVKSIQASLKFLPANIKFNPKEVSQIINSLCKLAEHPHLAVFVVQLSLLFYDNNIIKEVDLPLIQKTLLKSLSKQNYETAVMYEITIQLLQSAHFIIVWDNILENICTKLFISLAHEKSIKAMDELFSILSTKKFIKKISHENRVKIGLQIPINNSNLLEIWDTLDIDKLSNQDKIAFAKVFAPSCNVKLSEAIYMLLTSFYDLEILQSYMWNCNAKLKADKTSFYRLLEAVELLFKDLKNFDKSNQKRFAEILYDLTSYLIKLFHVERDNELKMAHAMMIEPFLEDIEKLTQEHFSDKIIQLNESIIEIFLHLQSSKSLSKACLRFNKVQDRDQRMIAHKMLRHFLNLDAGQYSKELREQILQIIEPMIKNPSEATKLEKEFFIHTLEAATHFKRVEFVAVAYRVLAVFLKTDLEISKSDDVNKKTVHSTKSLLVSEFATLLIPVSNAFIKFKAFTEVLEIHHLIPRLKLEKEWKATLCEAVKNIRSTVSSMRSEAEIKTGILLLKNTAKLFATTENDKKAFKDFLTSLCKLATQSMTNLLFDFDDLVNVSWEAEIYSDIATYTCDSSIATKLILDAAIIEALMKSQLPVAQERMLKRFEQMIKYYNSDSDEYNNLLLNVILHINQIILTKPSIFKAISKSYLRSSLGLYPAISINLERATSFFFLPLFQIYFYIRFRKVLIKKIDASTSATIENNRKIIADITKNPRNGVDYPGNYYRPFLSFFTTYHIPYELINGFSEKFLKPFETLSQKELESFLDTITIDHAIQHFINLLTMVQNISKIPPIQFIKILKPFITNFLSSVKELLSPEQYGEFIKAIELRHDLAVLFDLDIKSKESVAVAVADVHPLHIEYQNALILQMDQIDAMMNGVQKMVNQSLPSQG